MIKEIIRKIEEQHRPAVKKIDELNKRIAELEAQIKERNKALAGLEETIGIMEAKIPTIAEAKLIKKCLLWCHLETKIQGCEELLKKVEGWI